MIQAINTLVSLSHYFGANPEFVLAGGGNTSYKTPSTLFIKGSGTMLSNIKAEEFVRMDRAKLDAVWEKTYPANPKAREAAVLKDIMDSKMPTEYHKRPSVETLLHNLMNQKYVVHTHPPVINGITCSKNGEAWARKLFGSQVIWVPYTDPGYTLTRLVKSKLEKYFVKHGRHADVLLLQNHGLFVGGDSPKAVKSVTEKLIVPIQKFIRKAHDFSSVPFDGERAAQLAPALRMQLRKAFGGSCIAVFGNNREIQSLVNNRTTFKPLSSAYSPDHIVYYGPEPLFVPHQPKLENQYRKITQALKTYIKKFHSPPKLIAIQGLGVFAVSESKKSADLAMGLFLDAVKVSLYNRPFGGPRFMSAAQIQFIHHWEAESYRRKVSQGATSGASCLEKVAIVTGSAQGIGQGIAEALLKNGAHVVVADLNEQLSRQTAGDFSTRFGDGRALAVKVNVADPQDVKKMITETTLNYGGLDILVSNAGILRAGGLDQMSPENFNLVTSVNYNAFFHCAKYAADIMRLQNRYDAAWYTDIIQINSKSGLAGSKKNFAYAGAKFGGIGLTQSFALELVEYNIKVNAICPGNFFDGPLWSDPEKGLFVQYLKAGKVPGAKTTEDVKKFYESKVPMKRGCTAKDVARALLYVIEQEYETGQAIPVTGGQVQLK